MSSQNKACVVLKKAWKKLRKKDPRTWSLSQLAKKLKVSPGYLSKIFAGKQTLSLDLAKKILETLMVDEVTRGITLQNFQEKEHKPLGGRKKFESLQDYELSGEEADWLLGKWYRLNLLDLLTTSNFKNDIQWMARKLGITAEEVEYSLNAFEKSGLVERDTQGVWRKKSLKVRFPVSVSKKVIREHHQSQLKKAIAILESRNLPKDFNDRLVVGLSVACNPQKLDQVREILHLALYEAAEILSEDPCTEVYQLNLQLFPQTRSLKE